MLTFFAFFALSAEPPLVTREVALIREPSAPTAWGGPRTGSEPTLSQRVVDYELRAVLDPKAHTIDGTERITWRNRSNAPVRAIYLHLSLNAFESEGSTWSTERRQLGDERGEPVEAGQWGSMELTSVRQGDQEVSWAYVHPDDGPATDHTVVRFELPQSVAPGSETVLDVAFFDHLPRVVARSGFWGSFHLVAQWYPKVGVLELPGERGATAARWNCHEYHFHSEFYADFGAYQLEVVVPADVRVGASGVPSGPATVAADGVHHRYHVEDVHDVAFTAWDGYAPPLTGSTKVPGGGEVAVEVLFPPEYEASAHVALATTLECLRWFSQALGPYPYPKVTVVVPPFNAPKAGSMEYETFFTIAGALSPPSNSPSLARMVTVHEFGHGYFMGLLASNEFEEPFLDEGLNEWVDARMLDSEPLAIELPPLAKFVGLKVPPVQYWIGGLGGGRSRYPADPIANTSWGRWSSGSYTQVYTRTQVVMHDLGVLLGPEITERALRGYYTTWHHRHPSTADLREAFIAAGGDRALVTGWFDQQVYGASAIDDRVEVASSEEVLPALGSQVVDGGRASIEEGARDEQVEATRKAWVAAHGEEQPTKPGPFPIRSVVAVRRYGASVPRTVEVAFEDGSVERLEWSTAERYRRWELVRPVAITSARLDAAGPIFLDQNHLDDASQKKVSTRASVSFGLGAAGWLQLLFAVVEAL